MVQVVSSILFSNHIDMKKNFLFGTLAVLLAGFWFGGASLAACTDTDVACLNDTWYPSLKAAIEASADNDVITLLDNDEVSFDGSNLMLTIDKWVTIEGNGKYIKWVSNGYDSWHVTLIKGDKNITIKDLTFKNFGDTLWFDTNGTTTPIYVHRTYWWKLTLENVNIESYNSRGIVIGNGSFEINGWKIKWSSDQAYQQAIESYVSTNSSISWLEITGVKDLVNWDDITDAYGIMHAGNWTVTVTNTKIWGSRGVAVSSPTSAWASALSYDKSNWKLILWEWNEFEWSTNVIAIVPMWDPVEQSSSSTIEVSDWKYVGAIDKSTDTSVTEANIEISGGKFSVDPTTYVVAGKKSISIDESPYLFGIDCDSKAKIWDICYTSLRAAIEASADNDVITLLDNDEVSFDGSNLMLTIDKWVTIEGNGKYIKWVSNGYDSWHVTLIKGDKNITIKDLTFKNFGDTLWFDTNGTTTPIYVHRTYWWKLTLENVNIESYNSRGIVIGNGSFEINGWKIKWSSDQAYQQAIESYVSTNSSISWLEITGVKDLVNWDDITDAYGIMHAGNWTVTVTNTKIWGSRGVAVSSPTSAWASALSYDKSNWKLILWEWNEFEWSTNVIAIVPMWDPVEQSSSSTIEVSDWKYVGAIDKSTDTSVTEANIEISGGKFSVDPSAYVVAWKVAKSIS